jgi:hypothetical protein
MLVFREAAMPKLRFVIIALAGIFIGWLGGAILRTESPVATPSPLPAQETAIDLPACWRPGMERNAPIVVEDGCELGYRLPLQPAGSPLRPANRPRQQ